MLSLRSVHDTQRFSRDTHTHPNLYSKPDCNLHLTPSVTLKQHFEKQTECPHNDGTELNSVPEP